MKASRRQSYATEFTLEGINVSGEPLRLAQPRLVSRISGQQVAVELGAFNGWTAELTLPANGKVSLRAMFNPPSGVPAQQFIELWGECASSSASTA